VPTKLLCLIAFAALSTTGFAGAASAGCPVTGEVMDMMTAGGEAPCFAATPAANISPAGGTATPNGLAGCIAENGDGVTCAPGRGLKSAAPTPAASISPVGGAATPRSPTGELTGAAERPVPVPNTRGSGTATATIQINEPASFE